MITNEQAREVCRFVGKKHLSIKRACGRAGVSYRAFKQAMAGERPQKPEWREWCDEALAESNEYWIAKGEKYGDDKNNAGVNHAKMMVTATDRERFRDDIPDKTGKLVLNILVSPDVGTGPICETITVEHASSRKEIGEAQE